MSFPHFYNADPFYLSQVDGLNPVKEKHEFFMAFEPVRILKNKFIVDVSDLNIASKFIKFHT